VAQGDLDRIADWIGKGNPRAAAELANMGRPGLIEGTRELIEYPYIIIYQVDKERDEIVVLSKFMELENGRAANGKRL